MLYTTLVLFDPSAVRAVGTLRIGLTDEALGRVSAALERAGRQLTITVRATTEGGESVSVAMEWCRDACGFHCAANGFSAGFIHYDEIMGAIGVPASRSAQPVLVRLASSIDVWRRGVLHVDTGLVHVYTRQRMLTAADAYLIESFGAPQICIALEAGDPALGPLRLPSKEKKSLQGAADQQSALSSLDALIELMGETREVIPTPERAYEPSPRQSANVN